MLTDREILILNYLLENKQRFVTSKELANKAKVSIRTIKSDVKKIQSYFKEEQSLKIKTVRSKGITVEVSDFNKIYKIIEQNLEYNHYSLNYQNNRVNQLLLKLFENEMTKVDIQHKFNISESTVNNDLNNVKEILRKYNLHLKVNKMKRVIIVGQEQDKRKIIGRYKNLVNFDENNNFVSIENVILKILIEEEYMITEKVFNNILIHIQISINRIKNGNIITGFKNISNKWNKELNIAERIFKELSRLFMFEIHEGEIVNLAILLIGKSDYGDADYISNEISIFIDNVLTDIDEVFNVNFSNQIEDKLNLSLHLVPLLERLKYDIQLPNQQTGFIQQSFPLAFDISAYFSLIVQEHFRVSVTEDEMGYLAIHFNNFLIKSDQNLEKKDVLIISNIRRSESILLKQRLLTWFGEEVSNVTVLNYNEVSEEKIEKYDIIFSTDEDEFTNQFAPILISKFPRDNEYLNLKLSIGGFQGKDDILSLFKEELFCIDTLENKKDVFKKFSEITSQYDDIPREFMESVEIREDMSNTYFNNMMAFPHPAIPFSIDSFVSVILLKEPIIWNEDEDEVNVVMLVAIEKNNAKTFQLWNYLSGITKDKMFSKRVEKINNYKEFIDVLKLSIEYNN